MFNSQPKSYIFHCYNGIKYTILHKLGQQGTHKLFTQAIPGNMPLRSARHKHADLGLTIKHITHTNTHTHAQWSRQRYSHQRGCRCGWWRSCCAFPPPPWCQNPSAPATSLVCGVSPARHNTSLQTRQHDGKTGTDKSAQHFTTNTSTWRQDRHRQIGTTLHYRYINMMARQAPTNRHMCQLRRAKKKVLSPY